MAGQQEQSHCKQSHMLPLQVLNVAIVSPHSLGHYYLRCLPTLWAVIMALIILLYDCLKQGLDWDWTAWCTGLKYCCRAQFTLPLFSVRLAYALAVFLFSCQGSHSYYRDKYSVKLTRKLMQNLVSTSEMGTV